MIFNLLFSIIISLASILLVFYIFNKFLNNYLVDKKRIVSGMLYSVLVALLTSLITSLFAAVPYMFLVDNYEILATLLLLIMVCAVEQLLIRGFCILKAGPQLEYKNVGAFSIGYTGLTPLISASITLLLNLLYFNGISLDIFASNFSNIPILVENGDIMLYLRFFASSFASFVVMNLIILLLMYGFKKRNRVIFFISLLLEVVFSLLAYINNNLVMIVIYLVMIYMVMKVAYPRLKDLYLKG